MSRKHGTIPANSRIVVLASLVVIGAIACYNWCVAPHWNNLQAAHRYESATRTLASKNHIMNAGIARHKRELAQLKEKFVQARGWAFGPAGAKDFFNGIEAAAEETGCVLSSLTFTPTNRKSAADRPSGFLRPRHARLSVLGDYAGIIALMNEFQDRREKVLIDSISIESIGKVPGRLDCEMNVTVYVMQDEEASTNE